MVLAALNLAKACVNIQGVQKDLLKDKNPALLAKGRSLFRINKKTLSIDQKHLAKKIKMNLHRQLTKVVQKNIKIKQKQYLAKQELEKELKRKQIVSNLRKTLEFIVHLFPVGLIGLIASSVMPKVNSIQFFNRPLVNIMLFLALCIPWMAQMCCLSLFSRIGYEAYLDKNIRVEKTILKYTPGIILISLFFQSGLLGVFSLWAHFSINLYLYILGSCIFHSFFALLMTYGSSTKHWTPWLMSWIIYGLSFLIFPEKILYAPLFASTFMLVFLIVKNGNIPLPSIDKNVISQMLIGGMIGLLIWIDKIFAFNATYFFGAEKIKIYSGFSAWMIFVPLLPSIIGLNCYYVFFAPVLESKLNDVIYSIDQENLQKFLEKRKALSLTIQNIWSKIFVFTILLSIVFAAFYAHINNLRFFYILGIFLLPAVLTNITIALNSLLILRQKSTILKTGFAIFVINTIVMGLGIHNKIKFLENYSSLNMVLTYSMFLVLILLFVIGLKKWDSPHMSVLMGE